jgi:BASS family bile acid:Na+ symporter
VPPILPSKQLKLGGRANYVYGLLVAMSLSAIVIVPLAIEAIGWVFGLNMHIHAAEVAKLVGLSVLIPVVTGLLVRRVAPAPAERLEPLASKLGTWLLLAGLVGIFIKTLPPTWELVGNGTILAIAAVATVAIGAGHLIGGPDQGERRSLAMASAMRHPGVALAIARLNFPEERLVPAAVLLSLVVAIVATSVYGERHAIAG